MSIRKEDLARGEFVIVEWCFGSFVNKRIKDSVLLFAYLGCYSIINPNYPRGLRYIKRNSQNGTVGGHDSPLSFRYYLHILSLIIIISRDK